jgi:hypothetical protein
MEKVFLYAMEQNVDAIRFYQNKLYDKFQLILERPSIPFFAIIKE